MAAEELISQASETSSDNISCATSFTKTLVRHLEKDSQTQSQNLSPEESAVQSTWPRSLSPTQDSKLLKPEISKNLEKSRSSKDCVVSNEISGSLLEFNEESLSEINSKENLRLHHPLILKSELNSQDSAQ